MAKVKPELSGTYKICLPWSLDKKAENSNDRSDLHTKVFFLVGRVGRVGIVNFTFVKINLYHMQVKIIYRSNEEEVLCIEAKQHSLPYADHFIYFHCIRLLLRLMK